MAFYDGVIFIINLQGSGMLTSEQMDELLAESGFRPARKKTEVYAEFFKKYGEDANWEDWLAFLEERPELEGFDWARSLADRPLS
jgi:hypothetical protein